MKHPPHAAKIKKAPSRPLDRPGRRQCRSECAGRPPWRREGAAGRRPSEIYH